jgi:ammonium transporter Rh
MGLFTTYESTDDDGQAGSATLPDYAENFVGDFSPAKDYVQRLYPVFQDVHVMIFIGFGFLMTFIKTSSWSALAFNWIISAWALQWGILSTGFWH